MTILHVKNQLVSYFLGHDTFEFERHQLMVEFDKATADFRKEMLTIALTEMEAAGMLKKLTLGERTMWVLAQPIHSFQQQVVIGPFVVDRMANVINFMNEAEGVDIVCNKTNINEGDILRLVGILEEMIEDDDEPQAPKVPGAEDEETE